MLVNVQGEVWPCPTLHANWKIIGTCVLVVFPYGWQVGFVLTLSNPGKIGYVIMENERRSQPPVRSRKMIFLKYALMALALEKIIQHCFVSMAFILDLGNIRSSVVISPTVLIPAGLLVAALFVVALWALVAARKWAPDLLIGLALFDILGEFVAQGRIDITIPVSFVVALVLLVLGLIYRRQIRGMHVANPGIHGSSG